MAAPRSEEEVLALEKFKIFTKYEEFSDGILMRYLRARDLDFVQAEKAISLSMEWKLNHIEKQSFNFGEKEKEFQDTFSIYHTGFDCEGRIVLYIKFDDWLPVRPMFEKYKPSEVLLFAYHLLAKIHCRLATTKHQQIVAIWDNIDIGFSKIFHEVQNWAEIVTLRQVIQMVDLNFPETLFKAFMINTGRPVVWGFSLVRPFMRQYTLDKILINGSDQACWLPQMREYLSDDLIPINLGGTAQLNKSLHDVIRIL